MFHMCFYLFYTSGRAGVHFHYWLQWVKPYLSVTSSVGVPDITVPSCCISSHSLSLLLKISRLNSLYDIFTVLILLFQTAYTHSFTQTSKCVQQHDFFTR